MIYFFIFFILIFFILCWLCYFMTQYKITINDIMKLIIICKDENKEIDNNNKNLKVVCGLCGGEDTRTTIKIILEEYGDEITEIVSPKCDIIKNLME